MDEIDQKEKYRVLVELLDPALIKLKTAFFDVVNGNEDISKFLEAVGEVKGIRQLFNDAEKIGLMIGIEKYLLAVFPLTGNLERDVDQKSRDLPDLS